VPLRPRSAIALAALAVFSLTAAACGDDGYGSNNNTTTTKAPSDESSTTEATDPAGGAATVELTDSDLGKILTTSDGVTLYTFAPDNGGPSTCNGGCATTWPPLVADGTPTVGDGLDDSLFATATRDDGSEQVTVKGWPLYTYSADAAPGDTNGQGVGGVWYVVGADGKTIDND